LIMRSREDIVEILRLCSELEQAISRLYRSFALWDDPLQDFWKNLSTEELNHFKYLIQIIELVQGDELIFVVIREFNSQAVRSMIKFVQDNFKEAEDGVVHPHKFLFIARDIEDSLLENKFYEFLDSPNPDFKALIFQIISDTRRHRKDLIQKIEERSGA
jgi:rubrerythrin